MFVDPGTIAIGKHQIYILCSSSDGLSNNLKFYNHSFREKALLWIVETDHRMQRRNI